MSPYPGTIILALWPDATNVVIERLKSQYKTKYPTSHLFLLRAPLDFRSLPILRGKVLVHIYGDHAAAQVCTLLRSHYSSTGSVLDVETLIFDQPPKTAGWTCTIRPDYFLCSAVSLALSWLTWIVDQPPYDSNTWVRQDFEDSRLLPSFTKFHAAADTKSDHAHEESFIGNGLVPQWSA